MQPRGAFVLTTLAVLATLVATACAGGNARPEPPTAGATATTAADSGRTVTPSATLVASPPTAPTSATVTATASAATAPAGPAAPKGVAVVTKKGTNTFQGRAFLFVEFEIDGKPAEGGEPGNFGLAASGVQACWDSISVGGPVPACWPFAPGKLAVGDGPRQ